MPVQNVADIVGRRNLVEEAQGWAKVALQKQALKLKAEQAKEKLKPKPYQFKFADWGSKNQYMQENMGNLQDKSVTLTMADSALLKIPYYDERCGADCQGAHQRLRNRHHAAKTMQNLQEQFKSDYDSLKNLMENKPKIYNNDENRAKLRKMEEEWLNGLQLDIDSSTGRLTVLDSRAIMIQSKDDNGNPMYLDKDGKPTPDEKSAAKDENGEKIKHMVEGEEKENFVSSIDDYYGKLDIQNYARNAEEMDWGNMVDRVGVDPAGYDKETGIYTTSKESPLWQAMELDIFGSDGDTSDGYSITSSKTKPIIALLKKQKEEEGVENYVPTREDIIQFALNQAGRHAHIGEDDGTTVLSDRMSRYGPIDITGSTMVNQIDETTGDAVTGSWLAQEGGDFPYNPIYSHTLDKTGAEEAASVQFNTANITLLAGDDNLSSSVSGYNSRVKFTYSSTHIMLRNRSTGKFSTMSEAEFDKLPNEEKVKWFWDVAIEGSVTPTNDQMQGDWKNVGIGNAEGSSAAALIPASLIKQDVAQSSTKDSLNMQTMEDFEALKNQKNEKIGLIEGVIKGETKDNNKKPKLDW